MTGTNFEFCLGDVVKDSITGFKGVVVYRTQWLNNCNTYGLQPTKLKDGVPQDKQHFDQPQLRLVSAGKVKASRDTGGPERKIKQTNR